MGDTCLRTEKKKSTRTKKTLDGIGAPRGLLVFCKDIVYDLGFVPSLSQVGSFSSFNIFAS